MEPNLPDTKESNICKLPDNCSQTPPGTRIWIIYKLEPWNTTRNHETGQNHRFTQL